MNAPLGPTAAVGAGIVGGGFLVFSAAVMPALARLPPEQAVAVMRSVNAVIVRSPFVVVLVATAAACAGAVAQAPADPRTVTGAALYVLGAFGVTVAANVPLNEALARSDPAGPVRAWERYARRWTRWNHVRTVAAAAAAVVLAG